MRSKFQMLLYSVCLTTCIYAQNADSATLNIGDNAPTLRVREWLKGKPVKTFEKGTVYVVELWALACAPCRAAMPHLSAIAREYDGKVIIVGVDVLESNFTTPKKVKAFVDSMGNRMDYRVAMQDSNFVEEDWFYAAGEEDHGIPRTFVVNDIGQIAWIGHTKDLAGVLPKIVNNTWDIQAALTKRSLNKRLRKLDKDAQYDLYNYVMDLKNPDAPERPDSALLVIDEIVSKEPRLKYAPNIAYRTFACLLQTNVQKAYEYGKVTIMTPSCYEEPAWEPYSAIIGAIKTYSEKINLPPEIFRLGTEAYQISINRPWPYPELVNLSKDYSELAKWYWRISEKSEAIDALQKAIEELKKKKNYSAIDMAELESRLEQYRHR